MKRWLCDGIVKHKIPHGTVEADRARGVAEYHRSCDELSLG